MAAPSVSLEQHKDGVEVKGWRLRLTKGPILSSAECDEWCASLRLKTLPEMVFGANELRLEHVASGTTISLNARDALAAVTRVTPGEGQRVLIEAAPAWKERLAREQQHQQQQQQQKEQQQQHKAAGDAEKDGGEKRATGATATESDTSAIRVTKMEYDYDWTFATEYAGTVTSRDGSPVEAVPSTEHRVDIAALMRHDPILHYGEVQLFEDELHDHGMCDIDVKVRVMPGLFFCLMRFWVRVDGVNVRVRDTRFFHSFGTGHVVREIKAYEDSLEDLQRKNPRLEVYRANDPAAYVNTMTVILEKNEIIPLQ